MVCRETSLTASGAGHRCHSSSLFGPGTGCPRRRLAGGSPPGPKPTLHMRSGSSTTTFSSASSRASGPPARTRLWQRLRHGTTTCILGRCAPTSFQPASGSPLLPENHSGYGDQLSSLNEKSGQTANCSGRKQEQKMTLKSEKSMNRRYGDGHPKLSSIQHADQASDLQIQQNAKRI